MYAGTPVLFSGRRWPESVFLFRLYVSRGDIVDIQTHITPGLCVAVLCPGNRRQQLPRNDTERAAARARHLTHKPVCVDLTAVVTLHKHISGTTNQVMMLHGCAFSLPQTFVDVVAKAMPTQIAVRKTPVSHQLTQCVPGDLHQQGKMANEVATNVCILVKQEEDWIARRSGVVHCCNAPVFQM
jgi:hypothetical protein